MAELTRDCCPPGAQASCCEPGDKQACCGEHHAGGCGCSAGATPRSTGASASDVRESVRKKYGAAAIIRATKPPT